MSLTSAVLFLTGTLLIFIVGPWIEGRPLNLASPGSEVYTMMHCLPDRFLQRMIQNGYSVPDQSDLDILRSQDRNSRLLTLKYFVENAVVRKSSPCQNSLTEYLLDRKSLVKGLALVAERLSNSNVKFDVTCLECETVIELLKAIAKSHLPPEEIVVESLSFLCTIFKIESKGICRTVIKEFKDEFFYTASHLTMPVSKVCGILVPECSTFKNPLEDWNITLPNTPKPPVVTPTLPPASAPKLRILQLSDIHMDFNYQVGANAECGEPLCCTKGNGPAPTPAQAAGKWGDHRKCDIPYWTLENLFIHLNKSQTFDMIYWTGDLPSHHIWDQTREQQVYIYKNLTNLFLQYFPRTPVYGTLGNHESAPVNSFPPDYVTGNRSMSWLFDEIAVSWGNWLPKNDTMAFIKKGAYYTTLIKPGFRIISLNMNYCNNQNWWMMINTTDPTGELQFLVETLQKAEDNKELVHIIGHIPPGSGTCLSTWSWNYHRIVNRYESTIVAQFFGHTHTDSFELFFDEKNVTRPTSIAYVGPSVTSYPDLNPGFRIHTLDGDHKETTRMVLDHETYVMNLTEANLSGVPKWKLEYTAKDAYNLKSLLPSDWNDLVNRMKADDTLFTKYFRFYYKLADHAPCRGDCKTGMLCGLRSARSYDNTFCKGL
ncbi:sphingomyelin phosphodiesterase-like [Lineus longissimus]|uniref:sphingomyelin phosphodiesterase-like n=1 Tax=Lineus longissimus TaxID=88925 RepID=UPI002B4C7D5C